MYDRETEQQALFVAINAHVTKYIDVASVDGTMPGEVMHHIQDAIGAAALTLSLACRRMDEPDINAALRLALSDSVGGILQATTQLEDSPAQVRNVLAALAALMLRGGASIGMSPADVASIFTQENHEVERGNIQ